MEGIFSMSGLGEGVFGQLAGQQQQQQSGSFGSNMGVFGKMTGMAGFGCELY